MTLPRFTLDEDARFAAWLAKAPRAIVLFRGIGCPYSSYFERTYAQMPDPPGWSRVVREVEHGGAGPHGAANRIVITPTVISFRDGVEEARLEGKDYLGITRMAYARWVKSDVLKLKS